MSCVIQIAISESRRREYGYYSPSIAKLYSHWCISSHVFLLGLVHPFSRDRTQVSSPGEAFRNKKKLSSNNIAVLGTSINLARLVVNKALANIAPLASSPVTPTRSNTLAFRRECTRTESFTQCSLVLVPRAPCRGSQ